MSFQHYERTSHSCLKKLKLHQRVATEHHVDYQPSLLQVYGVSLHKHLSMSRPVLATCVLATCQPTRVFSTPETKLQSRICKTFYLVIENSSDRVPWRRRSSFSGKILLFQINRQPLFTWWVEGDYTRMFQVFPYNLAQVGSGIWHDGWEGTILGCPRYSHKAWYKSDLEFGMIDGRGLSQVFPHNLVKVRPGIGWKGTILGCLRYSHTTWYKSDLGMWHDGLKGTIFGCPRYSHTTWDQLNLGFCMMPWRGWSLDIPGIPAIKVFGILRDRLCLRGQSWDVPERSRLGGDHIRMSHDITGHPKYSHTTFETWHNTSSYLRYCRIAWDGLEGMSQKVNDWRRLS